MTAGACQRRPAEARARPRRSRPRTGRGARRARSGRRVSARAAISPAVTAAPSVVAATWTMPRRRVACTTIRSARWRRVGGGQVDARDRLLDAAQPARHVVTPPGEVHRHQRLGGVAHRVRKRSRSASDSVGSPCGCTAYATSRTSQRTTSPLGARRRGRHQRPVRSSRPRHGDHRLASGRGVRVDGGRPGEPHRVTRLGQDHPQRRHARSHAADREPWPTGTGVVLAGHPEHAVQRVGTDRVQRGVLDGRGTRAGRRCPTTSA